VYTAPAGSSDSRNAHSVDLFRVVRPPLRACSTRRFPAGPAMVWLDSLIEHPGCRETLIVKSGSTPWCYPIPPTADRLVNG